MATGPERPPASGESQARRLEAAVEQIAVLVRQPENAKRLRAIPGENEWTVLQTLGHCAELIPYWLSQCRMLIQAGGGEPGRFGRTPDDPGRLAGVERGAAGSPDELLGQVEAEARKGAAAIRAFTAEERAAKGINRRGEEMSVGDIVERFIVAHAEEHLKQIREALR